MKTEDPLPAFSPASKRESLRATGTLHPHPEQVPAPAFRDRAFFDPLDLLQVR